jgi:hypothetical protein
MRIWNQVDVGLSPEESHVCVQGQNELKHGGTKSEKYNFIEKKYIFSAQYIQIIYEFISKSNFQLNLNLSIKFRI